MTVIEFVNEMPRLALAIAPVAGALAWRGLWSRRRIQADIREREERVRRDREEVMRAMQEAHAAAEVAQKNREEFLARMSHELRTPLNAVIGFSRVLENNKAGNQRPEDIQLLGRVRAGGERLLRLVEDVLDQSQIEKGQLRLEVHETDVVAIAARVASTYRSFAATKGVRLEAVLPKWAPTVPLDAPRFEQVLRHLVDNAVKFTASGIVRLAVVTDAATNRPSRIQIADTGIGIPAQALQRIFQPFVQGDGGTARPYGGAGLGLPLAKQLCDAMGCRLSVESEVGIGSRFTIRLPEPDTSLERPGKLSVDKTRVSVDTLSR
jgi:signal transduction histidine kinase